MYLLPIIINQRRVHIAEFVPIKFETQSEGSNDLDDTTVEQAFIPEFIIKSGDTPSEILRIPYEAKLISKAGSKNDLDLRGVLNATADLMNSEEDSLFFNLSLNYSKDGDRIKENGDKLATQQSQDFLPFYFENDKTNKSLKLVWKALSDKKYTLGSKSSFYIKFRISIKNNTQIHTDNTSSVFEYTLRIHLKRPDKIIEAVIDFGSEASQIAFTSKDELHAVRIRETLSDNFFPGNGDKITNWAQQDYENSPNLFVSNFFIDEASNDRKMERYRKPFEFKNTSDGDDYLHILNDMSGIPTTMRQLPNIKLAQFSPDSVDFKVAYNSKKNSRFKVARDDIYMTILGQLIHALLAAISEIRGEEEKAKALKVTLLVPNIYSQKRVSQLIQDVTNCISDIFDIYEDDYGIYCGVEVQTFSESDAAFLGIMDNKDREIINNSRYLVVDAGKGTTDISVVHTGEKKGDYRGVFRTGFAGAGQVITYAILETLITVITNKLPQKRKEILHKIANSFDTQQKLQFFQVIEVLKRNISDKEKADYALEDLTTGANADIIKSILTPKEGRDEEFDNLKKLLKNINESGKKLGDYFDLIGTTVDGLCHEIIEKIKEINLNSNGEAIKFDTLILTGRAFKFAIFREKFKAKVEETFSISKTEWVEKLAKNACLTGCLNIPTGINLNSDIVGRPYLLRSGNKIEVKGGKWWPLSTRSKSQPVAEDDAMEFYLNGLTESDYSEAQKVIINGYEYNLNKTSVFDSENVDDVNIFYSGSDFLIRIPQEVYKLTQKLEVPDGNEIQYNTFLWRSLYPYLSKEAQIDDIYISNVK